MRKNNNEATTSTVRNSPELEKSFFLQNNENCKDRLAFLESLGLNKEFEEKIKEMFSKVEASVAEVMAVEERVKKENEKLVKGINHLSHRRKGQFDIAISGASDGYYESGEKAA